MKKKASKKEVSWIPNERLKQARERRRWTQMELANRIGACAGWTEGGPALSTVKRWESGETVPEFYYLELLCQVFEVKTPDELGFSSGIANAAPSKEQHQPPPAEEPYTGYHWQTSPPSQEILPRSNPWPPDDQSPSSSGGRQSNSRYLEPSRSTPRLSSVLRALAAGSGSIAKKAEQSFSTGLSHMFSFKSIRPVPRSPSPAAGSEDQNSATEQASGESSPPLPSSVAKPPATPSPPKYLTRWVHTRRELLKRLLIGAGVAATGGVTIWEIVNAVHSGKRVVATPTPNIRETPPITQRTPGRTPTRSSPELGSTLYVYKAHSKSVLAVAWSLSGDSIASGSEDETVRVWDPSSGHTVDVFTTSGVVSSVAWSPDGKHIASGGGDKAVVWDLASGLDALVYTSHIGSVYAVAWSPDGTRIASAGQDGVVRVWYPGSGNDVLTYADHTGQVYAVAWSPDGKRIASAGADKTVRVWDAVYGITLRKYTGHADWVYAVAWSPDGKRIASGGRDRTVEVWNANDGTTYLAFQGDMQAVQAVAWSPHGKYLVTGGGDKTVKIWDAADGHNVLTYTSHTDQVYAVAWSPDGKRIASASADKTVRVWDALVSASP